ncbi:type II secretion system GspH family protein [Patescibacteria group bacterium AH-259-L05]|nr:type II secretion system GspH family protein [Patescibacteria group bacterium AH-259-L05]
MLKINKKNYSLRVIRYSLRSGFTLIETLVYVAIIGIVIVSFVTFSISISNSRNKAYVTTEVQENARIALEVIRQRIHAANNVTIGSSTFDTDPGILSLQVADTSRNPTIIDLTADDGSLRITEGVNSPVIITSDEVRVVNLVFTNLTSPNISRENIRIEITVDYNTTGGDVEYNYSYSLQTAVSLRQ